MKMTWEGIKKIVNVKKTVNSTISQLNINGKIVDDPEEINNNFNNFFVNVGPDTEKNVPKVPNISPERFLKNRNQLELIIAHISEEEIMKLLKSLPTNKGTGPASIPLRYLLIIADLIITQLCHLINVSFSTGVFLVVLKIEKVIPLHKGPLRVVQLKSLTISDQFYCCLFSTKLWRNLCIKDFMHSLRNTKSFSKINLASEKEARPRIHLLRSLKKSRKV